MSIEKYEDRVTNFRKENPNCDYCISNKYYFIIEKVAECTARQMCCWNPQKIAKKCPLYHPRHYKEEEAF